jgi:hypothetical protein
METKATRDEMLLVINNFLSLAAETIIKNSDIELNSSYVVISKWMNSKGEEVPLLLTGRAILDGYSKRKTSQVIEEIQIIETKGNTEFLEKFYNAIMKLKK